jgi:multidrug efflux system membrane fusion protein
MRTSEIAMTSRKFFRRRKIFVTVGAFLLLALAASCSREATGNLPAEDTRPKMEVPVTASMVKEKTIPIELSAIGNVQPLATVAVKAQVQGELAAVHFKEGQAVKKGDLLFTIDSRMFEAELKQAQANLARERAQRENAVKQVERYASVVKRGYVAEEQFDQIRTAAAVLEASVRADEAAVERARLNLAYCIIRSPIDGVAGGIRVNPGNIVKANDNDKPLVILNQVSPVYVAFSVPERNLPEIRKYMAKQKLEVHAFSPGGESRPVRGELSFLENAVDSATGSIPIRAVFANEDRTLWPGQFVNVVLILTRKPGAVVIASQAIQRSQEGQYVFVIKPDGTVEHRTIQAAGTFGDETVIEKGVEPGEQVVTDGQLRLTSGSKVKIVTAGQTG